MEIVNCCQWSASRETFEEFRANGGKVGEPFEGGLLLLLTTTGARSGQPHTIPLVYLPDGDRLIILASAAGVPRHPAWYHNLVAHPKATVEVGTETFEVTATITTGEEREQLWAKTIKQYPGFADYQTKTTRQLPVILLQR
ncbi:MAG TPA: nitroreductase family deazaflavin-dependent oxidoreductase [Ktedonobacteraceae bacterium]